jgi:uncharacterized protein YcaQ
MPTLDIDKARKIVLLKQQLHISSRSARGRKGALNSILHLGYLQIDSISVIARAHHHCLYNRVKNYTEDHLHQLLTSKQVFEYWSHAAAFLPIDCFRFTLPRKQAIKSGEKHWFTVDKQSMADVLARITDMGPMMVKDFSTPKKSHTGWWDWKPAKIALEQLYMQGDIMVCERKGIHKVYDLTDRVLPDNTDLSVPTPAEHCQFLIMQYLQANGLAKLEHFGYLRKGLKDSIKQQLAILIEQGEIIQIQVAEQQYYAIAQILDCLQQKLSVTKVKILSPFDNLLIQRKRMQELFNFHYQIECYVPAAKRVFGYFSLPLLQGRQFVGRMDVKIHRKEACMRINHLHLDSANLDQSLQPLGAEIQAFMRFNQASSVQLDSISATAGLSRTSLSNFKQGLSKVVDSH